MMKRYLTRFCLSLLLVFAFCNTSVAASEPFSLYLSIERNPTTEMTIRWITDNQSSEDRIYYRQKGYPNWILASGEHIEMPDRHPYFIHRVRLCNLEPDSEYIFKIGEEGTRYKFKTLPKHLYKPINFVVGGDMYHDDVETYAETNRAAAATRPLFAMLGGDIAYSAPMVKLSSMHENFQRWMHWLKAWTETMVTPDGYIIPMIITIGNHEVIGRYLQPPSKAEFFYALFKWPETKSYQTVDFGKYMSIFVLDSGHTEPIEGPQAEWLASELAERELVVHKFALYHVPAYPSVRKFTNKYSQMIRNQWVPSFERYGLNVAFENHDHTYKRTYPITQNEIDTERGVLYLGDGAWGVAKPRHPATPSERWYLARTKSQRHFIQVVVSNDERRFMATDPQGKIFDDLRLRVEERTER